MKRIFIAIAALTLCGGVAFSQEMLDVYKYSQQELNGTARYLGMGGAFGALGGDISAMKSNPAGLAVYRSSEVVTTLSFTNISTKTDWLGSSVKNDENKVSFDNIAYVGYFPTANDVGILSWNAGFSYNRVKNFRRNYTMSAAGGLDYSLSDYAAERAFGYSSGSLYKTDGYNPYNNVDVDWLSALAYNGGFIQDYEDNNSLYYSQFSSYDGTPYQMRGANLNVYESGSIDEYDISFGMNISDLVLLGGTVAITDISYNMETTYDEDYANGDNLYIDNGLATDGSGYSFNIGAIVRPTDYLRLGVAYNSPTWYKMTDHFYGEAGSSVTIESSTGEQTYGEFSDNTPSGAYYDYELRSPDKWLFSAAAIFGQTALLSVDYELVNYKNMRAYDYNGTAKAYTNGDIETNFGMGNNLRVGAEVKVTPQFAVRAGASWSNTPIKAELKNGDVEVFTAGTIPNYTINKDASNYTIGLGYRFTPAFYADLACVLSKYKEDAYAFSNLIVDGEKLVESQSATLKTSKTRVALTLGYKF